MERILKLATSLALSFLIIGAVAVHERSHGSSVGDAAGELPPSAQVEFGQVEFKQLKFADDEIAHDKISDDKISDDEFVLVSSSTDALDLRAHPGVVPADTIELFRTADACMSCHNGLITPSGEDVSIGVDWRASMMANSARDPYWHAAVRRETIDHPEVALEIEDECSTCHMPMAHFQAKAEDRHTEVFAHATALRPVGRDAILAMDGVSCTTCHQISAENLGTRESFTGGIVLTEPNLIGQRQILGPFEVDEGRKTIMHSASNFEPAQGMHLQESEMCATCHTLYTNTLGPGGEVIGELPEQVPYLEWQHSSYREERSCQSCHMPVVEDSTAITSVLGQPRPNFSRHVFRGGNFFMLSMLNRYRDELGVVALPNEFDAAVNRTIQHLTEASARISIEDARRTDGRLEAVVSLQNLAGHKLPTAYPSRRVWIHFTVSDANGRVVFESGALQPSGSIMGNNNDVDPSAYEPHYEVITRSDQVQIYEPILQAPDGAITTGLLTAVGYAKDNRLLPRGFDKRTAHEDVGAYGAAYDDDDFVDGSDRIVYRVDAASSAEPLTVVAELWYQPIGFRWAQNLRPYDAYETTRFVRYFDSMSTESAVRLASASAAAL